MDTWLTFVGVENGVVTPHFIWQQCVIVEAIALPYPRNIEQNVNHCTDSQLCAHINNHYF